eukprot:TRINITY_DN41886_c0_g1_i1.p1 TRINITY_DN41886_c0_g1~~TRINITY_DN41886_c0_g1_i1.p1  ORF type:complete len:942 (-),score=172.80 TRINITY_DN41886_c0_g1_i1:266-3091(-)
MVSLPVEATMEASVPCSPPLKPAVKRAPAGLVPLLPVGKAEAGFEEYPEPVSPDCLPKRSQARAFATPSTVAPTPSLALESSPWLSPSPGRGRLSSEGASWLQGTPLGLQPGNPARRFGGDRPEPSLSWWSGGSLSSAAGTELPGDLLSMWCGASVGLPLTPALAQDGSFHIGQFPAAPPIEDNDSSVWGRIISGLHDSSPKAAVAEAASSLALAAPDVAFTTPPSTPRADTKDSLLECPGAPRVSKPQNVLTKALISGDEEKVRAALLEEPDAARYSCLYDATEPALSTAIRHACSVETLKMLLDHGANVNEVDRAGNTPLGLLCSLQCQDTGSAVFDMGRGCLADLQTESLAQHQERTYAIAEALINAGADMHTGSTRRKVWEVAQEAGNDHLESLWQSEADPSQEANDCPKKTLFADEGSSWGWPSPPPGTDVFASFGDITLGEKETWCEHDRLLHQLFGGDGALRADLFAVPLHEMDEHLQFSQTPRSSSLSSAPVTRTGSVAATSCSSPSTPRPASALSDASTLNSPPRAPMKKCSTSLDSAVSGGRVEEVRQMLEEDPLAIFQAGSSLLCAAVQGPCAPAVVQLLLEYGADANGANSYGRTPLSLLSEQPCLNALFDMPAFLGGLEAPRTGTMELQLARSLEIAKTLAAFGADCRRKDVTGWSPVELAEEMGNKHLLDFWRSCEAVTDRKVVPEPLATPALFLDLPANDMTADEHVESAVTTPRPAVSTPQAPVKVVRHLFCDPITLSSMRSELFPQDDADDVPSTPQRALSPLMTPVATPRRASREVDCSSPRAFHGTVPGAPVKAAPSRLHTAVAFDDVELLRELLEAEPEAVRLMGMNDPLAEPLLCCAARYGCSLAVVQLLVEYGADVEAVDREGKSALDILGGRPLQEPSFNEAVRHGDLLVEPLPQVETQQRFMEGLLEALAGAPRGSA